MFGLLASLTIVPIILIIAVGIFTIVVKWMVFQKAGKGGWEALIPIYNIWIQIQISGIVWWFIFIYVAVYFGVSIPFIGLISMFGIFCCNYNLAIRFGKDPIGYGIGLTLVPSVFFAILAFSDATYTEVKVSKYGVIPEEKVQGNNQNSGTSQKETTSNAQFCKNCGAKINNEKFCPKCGTKIHD
jgi:hypothetical protein